MSADAELAAKAWTLRLSLLQKFSAEALDQRLFNARNSWQIFDGYRSRFQARILPIYFVSFLRLIE